MVTGSAGLAAWLPEMKRLAVLTGAGISTDSGIPDFRGPQGLWTKNPAAERLSTYQVYMTDPDVRRRSWQSRLAHPAWTAEPNAAHQALAALAGSAIDTQVITQNIDGLHQESGIPATQVIELHGNTTYATCLSCEQRYEIEDLRVDFERDNVVPACACGGYVKSATISFGQSMPVHAMQRAEAETLACDLFVAIGSSLVVYPAAGFPELAKRAGAELVIVNRDPTGLDGVADVVLNRAIGDTLGEAVGVA